MARGFRTSIHGFIGSFFLSAGILAGPPALAAEPAAGAVQKVTFVVPRMELAEGSTAAVEKDGVKIILEVEPFVEVVHHRIEVQEDSGLFIFNNQHTYLYRRIPSAGSKPSELRFKVRVVNNLPNVLKLAGSVLSLTANGKQVPVPASAYSEMINGIVRPRQQQEYALVGPAVEKLPDNANVLLALDDVVTAVDGAGNPTKRSSFEWIYTVVKRPEEKEIPLETGKLTGTPEAVFQQLKAMED